ncbi:MULTISPECIES: hypothetical protein [unclassified Colwellia]|nr:MULTISPECIES: hypothetical protein [unclassified Colwellia]
MLASLPCTQQSNIALYDYHNSRSIVSVVNYLDGYDGYLKVDW